MQKKRTKKQPKTPTGTLNEDFQMFYWLKKALKPLCAMLLMLSPTRIYNQETGTKFYFLKHEQNEPRTRYLITAFMNKHLLNTITLTNANCYS